MLRTSAIAALVGAAAAFPGMTQESVAQPQQENVKVARDVPAGPAISYGQTNCGFSGPCRHFNPATQYVSTSGANAYQDPTSSDLRGPCPGLNAAANHGYLSRSGVTSISNTVVGLAEAYGMAPTLGAALATYAVVFEGDLLTLSWSIGGPQDTLLGGLLGKPSGISYSHNNYEGDSSSTRQDYYLNNGNAYSLQLDRFETGYTYTQNGGYTMDSFRQLFQHWQTYSEQNNPRYAVPVFSTFLVSPAAYNFVINFMSNKSAENPSGFLSPENYQTFFAVSGTPGNFVYNEGKERIPDNFYKRPDTNQYTNVDVLGDVGILYAAYPSTAKIGGNVNGVNSFAGIDLGNLTGGVYNLKDLANPVNFACFIDSYMLQFIPYFLKPSSSALASALALINKQGKFAEGLSSNCPTVPPMDLSVFNKYPGMQFPGAPGSAGILRA